MENLCGEGVYLARHVAVLGWRFGAGSAALPPVLES